MKIILCIVLFALFFVAIESGIFLVKKVNPYDYFKAKVKVVSEKESVASFIHHKNVWLKRNGVGFYIKEGITVIDWYMYKLLFGLAFFIISFLAMKIMKTNQAELLSPIFFVLGFMFLDLYIKLKNQSESDAMMPDVMEMSRSVLYGKRGGQYITDALKDAVYVVENKRLKIGLIAMRNQLDAGASILMALSEFEASFNHAEISAFCTVIGALQSTGQVEEALKSLEANVEREQVSVNKRRLVLLENQTMAYVLLIAFDILALLLYCVVSKIVMMQIGF